MKAYAKANIFLKIIGFDERNYHLLQSRFVLLDDFFDELSFVKEKNQDGFEIISNFNQKDNILYKVYDLLAKNGFKNDLENFFKDKSLRLVKNIPIGGGLGGGSSDAVAFLLMLNEELNLKLSHEKLLQICTQLGSDLVFFLSGFKSANVSGCGEIVEYFEDDFVDLAFFFPSFSCNTKEVYKAFDTTNYDLENNQFLAKKIRKMKSREILELKNTQLNDLFTPCAKIYPKMQNFIDDNYFLSGSGSSVFKVKI